MFVLYFEHNMVKLIETTIFFGFFQSLKIYLELFHEIHVDFQDFFLDKLIISCTGIRNRQNPYPLMCTEKNRNSIEQFFSQSASTQSFLNCQFIFHV